MAIINYLKSTATAAGTTLAAVFLAGCVTSGQGEKMRADIAQLTDRMEAMEKRDQEINAQVARLRKVLDEATVLLGRNSADLGTKVAHTESDIAAMSGKIEEAKYLAEQLQQQIGEFRTRLTTLEQGQQKITDRVAPNIPEDKEALWKEAQTRLAGGMREDARRFLRSFAQRFPDDPRAAQGQLQIGMSFTQELKHANAVAEYMAVMSKFPRSPEVSEAMWQLGESYVAMKYCTDAKAIFMDLAKRYPKSPRAPKIKERLHDLGKISKDRNYCTS